MGSPAQICELTSACGSILITQDVGHPPPQHRSYNHLCCPEQASPVVVACSSRHYRGSQRASAAWLQQAAGFAVSPCLDIQVWHAVRILSRTGVTGPCSFLLQSSTGEPPEDDEGGSQPISSLGDAEASASAAGDEAGLDDFDVAAYEAEMRKFAEEVPALTLYSHLRILLLCTLLPQQKVAWCMSSGCDWHWWGFQLWCQFC